LVSKTEGTGSNPVAVAKYKEFFMIELRGKYNFAKIYIDEIDEETIRQIYLFLNNPAFEGMSIRIMPDTHAGKGAVIGFTATPNKYVIPYVIGVDIGCGVYAYKLYTKNIDRSAFDDYVRLNVPAGFSKRAKPSTKKLDETFEEACIETEQSTSDVWHSIGTLGGGNHFIEIDGDEESLWLVIHTGSRNFGLRVANYYQKKAKEAMGYAGDAYRDAEFMEKGTREADDYIKYMNVAQKYADLNRRMIATDLGHFFGIDLNKPDISSVHNYIDLYGVIRKGAISAHLGEKVLIPLNMLHGTMVCIGKGNVEWNNSAPHGAGRIMSRSQAKKRLDVDFFQLQMKDANIYTTTANRSTIDEAPEAYKDPLVIKEAISETVDIISVLKPVYSFKSAE
jgi:tRNA-splicing ligase RtcB (3'-phosphate/5'-hydroxy nucleic acid ligase)